MRKHPKIAFLFIIFLTAICIVINLSTPFEIKQTIKNPFTQQDVKIDYKWQGIPFIHNFRDFSFRRGLDLQGGTSITLQADMKDIAENQRDNALNSAKEVIEKRINFLGVSEPVVQTSKAGNDYRVLVEIPGVTDVNQAVQLVGRTAKLSFWEEGTQTASPSANEDGSIEAITVNPNMPLGVPQILGENAKETNLSGSDLEQANVIFDPNTGKPQVELKFSPAGSKKFADITKRNVGKVVGIVLDDQLIEAPRVNEPIFGGSAVISGNFTTQQANNLQIQLNAGALPVSLKVLEQRAIGATLGQESVQKSMVAGALGFAVIAIFMTVLYGRLGFIASLALAVYSLFVLTLFRVIPVTLTLAGIAGFILSVGIAVDANILIFERMKEELRRGRSHAAALELGFSRAWLSIRDSNVASLITSTVLFYFGTSIVRGFAFTLALGIIVSLFTAIFVTRTFLQLFDKKD